MMKTKLFAVVCFASVVFCSAEANAQCRGQNQQSSSTGYNPAMAFGSSYSPQQMMMQQAYNNQQNMMQAAYARQQQQLWLQMQANYMQQLQMQQQQEAIAEEKAAEQRRAVAEKRRAEQAARTASARAKRKERANNQLIAKNN